MQNNNDKKAFSFFLKLFFLKLRYNGKHRSKETSNDSALLYIPIDQNL